MPALNFQKQFVEAVESGAKRQTIRHTWIDGKFPFQTGSTLQFYFGLRTKQSRKIGKAVCTGVKAFQLERNGAMWVGGERLTIQERFAFAQADGFEDPLVLWDWFKKHHDLPFDGWVVYW